MISRFFKKKPKKTPAKPSPKPKSKPVKSQRMEEKPTKPTAFKKLLTAEGWKRLMLRKSSKK